MSLEDASFERDLIDIFLTLYICEIYSCNPLHYILHSIIGYVLFFWTPGRMSLKDALSVRDPIDISLTLYVRNIFVQSIITVHSIIGYVLFFWTLGRMSLEDAPHLCAIPLTFPIDPIYCISEIPRNRTTHYITLQYSYSPGY